MKYFDSFEEGRIYHIFNHAVGSENLFRHAENYRYFLQQYHTYVDTIAWTYCYCLMPNHFHFLIQFQPTAGNDHRALMQPFSNFLNSYTKAYNKMFARRGALFINRTRRKLVSSDLYLHTLINYIHENPVRDGFCRSAADWRYSSSKMYGDDAEDCILHAISVRDQLFAASGLSSASSVPGRGSSVW